MKIHIIRHGEPNYENDCLTNTGIQQAQALAGLGFGENLKIYSSPLGRAQETAFYTAKASVEKIETLYWLREMDDVVVYDTRRPDLAVWNLLPSQLRMAENNSWVNSIMFKQTNLNARWEEICQGTNALLNSYGITKTENCQWEINGDIKNLEIAIFCHLGVGLTFLANLLQVCPITLWRTAYLAPCSVTTLLLEHHTSDVGEFRMLKMGDTAHLVSNGLEIGTTGLQFNVK